MYEADLDYLRGFEGAPLREFAQSPKIKRIIDKEDDAYVIGVELLQVLVNSIESNAQINPSLFRTPLFKAFFQLGLNKDYLETFVKVLFEFIAKYLKRSLRFNEEFGRLVNKYKTSIILSINEYGYINNGYSLNGIEEYKTSKTNSRVAPLSRKRSDRTIQTLFPYSRYWYPISERGESYTPTQFNKSVKDYKPLGKSLGVFRLSYEISVVYNDTVYLKKPGVKLTEDKFIESEWDVFAPKRFNKSKSFTSTYSELLKGVYLDLSQNASSINSITSDSKVKTYPSKYKSVLKDTGLLVNSFGGSGKDIYEKLVELRLASGYMGGHEGSTVGAVNYLSTLTEYLTFMTTGQLSSNLRQQGYGDFNKVFPLSSDSLGESESINGLRFLEKFSNLRSFLQNLTLPEKVDFDTRRISLNPLYAKYVNNIEPNYSIKIYAKTEDEVDFVDQSLGVLLDRCKYFGDKLEKIAISLNNYGQLPGYEALGSIDFQIDELQKSFPPVTYLNESDSPGGVTGCLVGMKNGYSSLSKSLDPFSLPPSLFSKTVSWMRVILAYLEEVRYELTALGIKTSGSGFLPNIETKKFISSSSDLIKYLSSLGFKDSEINQILEVKTFPEFISKFAPLSDSADLNSFFKGYELSQLIYEFSGDKGVTAYLDFLYKKSSIGGLLNLLSSTDKSKSDETYLRAAKYPKLIALLLGLTYAIDPEQLNLFYSLLGDNNINLLESVSLLIEKDQNTIVSRKEDISILDGLVEQLVRGNYGRDEFSSPDLDYSQVKNTSPAALKKWTKIVDKSLGRLRDKKDIENLYDKSVGLTIKELISLLNSPSSTSGVAQVFDGFSGGRLTKVIKYANMSGLAAKLGYYKNSSQLDNKWVDFDKTYYAIPSLLDILTEIIDCFGLTIKLIESSTNVDWSGQYYNKPNMMDLVVNSQNKPPESMINLISNQRRLSKSELFDSISKQPPQEAPGIGNSRLPNRAAIPNSITPEQAKVLSTSPSANMAHDVVNFSAKTLITKFIKATERTLILNRISQPQESEAFYPGINKFGSLTNTTRSESVGSIKDEDLKLYLELRGQDMTNNGSNKNYIADSSTPYQEKVLSKLPSDLVSSFSPLESCKKFKGLNCESLYGDDNRCVDHLNKSLAPEEYKVKPLNNGLVVDRPLGYFSEYLPSDGDIISNKLPSFYSLLDSPSPGRDSEPMVGGLNPVPSGSPGDMVEYANTQFALFDFAKSSGKEYTELTCASLTSTSDYQMCINLLKCKRFKIDNVKGDTRLKFCPPGTSGGRKKL